MASIDDQALIGFLRRVGEALPRPIVLVAAGGTAVTLLNAKATTRDVDFTGPGDDIDLFRSVVDRLPHAFDVDTWRDGQVFLMSLPDDYLERSVAIDAQLPNVELRALHPVDIVVTKTARLIERDVEDIEALARRFDVDPAEVEARLADCGYAANDELLAYNLREVCDGIIPRARGQR